MSNFNASSNPFNVIRGAWSILLVLVGVCTSNPLFTQKEQISSRYTRTLSHAEYSESFYVAERHKKYHAESDITYYYLKGREINATQGGYSGILLHGDYESFYPNRSLRSKGVFKHGKKEGTWRFWDEQGILLRAETWKDGQQHGTTVICNQLGKDSLLVPYKKSLKHGKLIQVDNKDRKKIGKYRHGEVLKKKRENLPEGSLIHTTDSATTTKSKKKERLEKKTNEQTSSEVSSKTNSDPHVDQKKKPWHERFKKSKAKEKDPKKAKKKEKEPFYKKWFAKKEPKVSKSED